MFILCIDSKVFNIDLELIHNSVRFLFPALGINSVKEIETYFLTEYYNNYEEQIRIIRRSNLIVVLSNDKLPKVSQRFLVIKDLAIKYKVPLILIRINKNESTNT